MAIMLEGVKALMAWQLVEKLFFAASLTDLDLKTDQDHKLERLHI